MRNLTHQIFATERDNSRAEYLYINITMTSKNVKASLNLKENSDLRKSRMHELSDKKTCHRQAFHDFLTLAIRTLLYSPKFRKICSQVIGKCKLGDVMKKSVKIIAPQHDLHLHSSDSRNNVERTSCI